MMRQNAAMDSMSERFTPEGVGSSILATAYTTKWLIIWH